MDTLALKINQNRELDQTVKLTEVTDSSDKQKDRKWYKYFLNSILNTNDLDLEIFERIESKKTITSIKNDFH